MEAMEVMEAMVVLSSSSDHDCDIDKTKGLTIDVSIK